MKFNHKIVDITADNLDEYPQVICFINPKHEYYHYKVDWLKEEFKNGLKIKLLFIEEEARPVGFIEFVRGDNCWRAVNANGYLFIHCLWTNGKKYQGKGLGNILLQEVEKEAKGSSGVAVVTSDKAFMASKALFLRNGYEIVSESGKDQLLVKQLGKSFLPSFNDWESELKKYAGLNILYSKQCPWVARFIQEVQPILAEENLKTNIIEIETARDAQNAPSVYSVFNLIFNGKLLADRYISTTRFKNIIKKELR